MLALDRDIEEAIARIDRQIANLAVSKKTAALHRFRQEHDAAVDHAMRVYERINGLSTKLFSPAGNLINQVAVRDRVRQVQKRLIRLRELRSQE